jgi:hypothetical protein
MNYRGPGLIVVVRFGSFPLPSLVSKLYRRYIGGLRKRDNLHTGERSGWEGVGAKLYDGEKEPVPL